MFKKRKVLILFACLSFVFPIHSLAANKATTEVGIGFAEESSNSQEEPTTDSTTTDSKKEIPKTGDSATTDSTTTGDQQKVNNVSRTTRYGVVHLKAIKVSCRELENSRQAGCFILD